MRSLTRQHTLWLRQCSGDARCLLSFELASQGSSPARRRSHFVPRCGSQPRTLENQRAPGGRVHQQAVNHLSRPTIATETGSPFANGRLITLCRRIKQRQLGRGRLAAPRPLTFVQEDLQLPSQKDRQLAACARVLRIRPWNHVSTVGPRHISALLRWSRLRNSNTQK